MGGRYGASSDGSSDYQDRRPGSSKREPEQQTVAEAVREVTQRHQQSNDRSATQDTNAGSKYQHSARSQTDTRGRSRASPIGRGVNTIVVSMIDVDAAVADLVAEQLVEQIRKANEEELVDDDRYK